MEKTYVSYDKYVQPTEDTYNTALLELTDYCNLNCMFCFNASSMGNKKHMTMEAFRIIVDKLKKHVYYVQLSGGEPLANPCIQKIIDYLIEVNLRFHINTNGTLLDDLLFDKLLTCNLGTLQFSLDGACQQTDDYIRGKGHFNTVTSLMKRFSEYHFNRGLSRMVITSSNYREVKDFFYLNLEYGFIPTFSFLMRSGRADTNWNDICINNNIAYNIREIIRNLFDSNKKFFLRFQDPHVVERFRELNLGCVGECQFNLDKYRFLPSVSPNGNVHPCESLFQDEFIIGNILSEDPDSIFSARNPKVVEISKMCKKRKRLLDTEICCNCEINEVCGKGCVAKSISHGNIYGPPDDCDIRKRDYENMMRNCKKSFVSKALSQVSD